MSTDKEIINFVNTGISIDMIDSHIFAKLHLSRLTHEDVENYSNILFDKEFEEVGENNMFNPYLVKFISYDRREKLFVSVRTTHLYKEYELNLNHNYSFAHIS